jgi:mannose-1-phosphate guanylyltransferase
VVTIFPSDHFIGEENRFLSYVEKAISFIEKYPDYAIILGVKPTDASAEYGWIEPSKKFLLHENNRFYKVVQFAEKPRPEIAQQFYNKGSLWNSLVLTAKSETLVKMYQRHLKEIYEAFKRSKSLYGTKEEEQFIEDVYDKIPSKSFSKCVLEEIPESLYVLKAEGILWSDWGNKEQVLKDLDSMGMLPK